MPIPRAALFFVRRLCVTSAVLVALGVAWARAEHHPVAHAIRASFVVGAGTLLALGFAGVIMPAVSRGARGWSTFSESSGEELEMPLDERDIQIALAAGRVVLAVALGAIAVILAMAS